MDLRGAAKGLDKAFYYILLGILVLNVMMYLFVFILNWEAWFFGMKLDGTDAGILLFAYFFIPAVLAYLLFRYPGNIAIIALLSIFFFGFHFIDSAATIQALSGGRNSFSGFLAAMVVIPLIVLVGHIIAARLYDREKYIKEEGLENRTISGILEIEEQDKNMIKQILALIIVAVVIVLFLGPVVIIPGLILLLLILILLAVKKRYDAKKRGLKIEGEITGKDLLFIITVFAVLFLLLFVMIAISFLLGNN